jgi:hypothetical protein
MAFEFMNSAKPCPSIEITEKGKFKKDIYYLDSLSDFTKRPIEIRWGSMMFNEKVPVVIK